MSTPFSPREADVNPRALGWDIHRKFSQVSLMEKSADGEIRVVERARLEHDDPQDVRQWLSRLGPEIPRGVGGDLWLAVGGRFVVQLAQECAGLKNGGQADSLWSCVEPPPGEIPACPHAYCITGLGCEATGA
jgi:hypothetical protein